MIRRNRGFTLVELLVTIAIIGIFIAMMLPAIQSARETGRRAVCTSNMTRLALATDGYRSARGYYPAGVTDAKGPILSRPTGQHHNWIEKLLPYLDERAVASKIDSNVSVYDPKNAAIRKLRISELICPSDDIIVDVPHSSYAACHHDVEAPIDANNHGVFFLNSKIKPDDITDGLAYTLFISEKQTEGDGRDLGWLSGTRATLRNTGSPLNATGPRSPIAVQADAEEKAPLALKALEEQRGDSARASDSSPSDSAAPPPAASKPKSKSPPPWQSPNYVGGFGSDHPGGIVIAAFGDESVRNLSDLIDSKVLQLLGNRADGQVIDPQDLQR
jgi:prepilin-type N-terminal cleavage/methylation domain-containing protein